MISEEDVKSWLSVVMKSMPHDALTRVAVRLWVIWHVWRKVFHEDVYQSPLSTHCFVEDLLMIKPVTGSGRSDQHVMPPRWLPHYSGYQR